MNVGGGLGIAYASGDEPRRASMPTSTSTWTRSREVFDPVPKILFEPGRSLVGNAGITVYSVGTVKEIPGRSDLRRRRRRHVGQPAADALRLPYEALIANRAAAAPDTTATIAGKHCESGDILVRDVGLADPRPGDRPRHAGDGRLRLRDGQQLQRRPPAAGRLLQRGRGPTVVRRETYEDLVARDV